jgi:hypothetical protein
MDELIVTERMLDTTGAPIGPWRARFTTAIDEDTAPPMLLAQACALDESVLDAACLLADDARVALRISADEPVRVALSFGDRTLHAVAARGAATLEATGLASSTLFSALLTMEDMAGHIVTFPFELATTEPLITLSIAELRADPIGPEPRQEYVEVLNYGPVTLELNGISLSDRTDSIGDVVLAPQRLLPGQRALLVPDDFDPEDPSDPPVPAAVPLVRIGHSLGSGGLSNTGEPLFLRDAAVHRLSAAPAMASSPGMCQARIAQEPRQSNASFFALLPCTPGVP